MDQDLLAEIAHSDSRHNISNFSQRFLEGKIGLLVLAKLALELANVFNAMLKRSVLTAQLLVHFGAQVVDVFALVLDLIGLLIHVVSEVVELLFGELG